VECKLRYVNFRRVSDCRRAFRPAFGVTGISDDWYKSTMGVTVIRLRTTQSAEENFGCAWEHLGAAGISLGAPKTSLEAPTTSLGAPMTSLGTSRSASDKPGSTSNHCKAVWKNDIFFRNVAGASGNYCYYLSFNNF